MMTTIMMMKLMMTMKKMTKNNNVYPDLKSATERDAYQTINDKILEAANQIGNRNKARYIWNYTK